MNALEIHKYGGTSMADAEAMMQSAAVVKNSTGNGKALLTVVSAMSDVTKGLQGAVNESRSGRHWDLLREISDRHFVLIEKTVDPKQCDHLQKMVQNQLLQAHSYIEAMITLNTITDSHFDWISSLGERLVAPVFTAHLQSAGINAVYHQAASIMATDGVFGNSSPLITGTRDRMKEGMVSDLNQGRIVITEGYQGSDKKGNITAFSRGGSDLSATAWGHALTTVFAPIAVYLYKADVAGVMSADPRIVNNAHIVPHLLYEEAAALTALGGKIIHPKAIHHAVRSGNNRRDPFPIYVKSTINPKERGTIIDNKKQEDDEPVKAISVINDAVRLEVRGWGMDKPGIMRKITGVLADKGLDIDFIGQPYSKLALDLAFQFKGQEVDLERLIKEELAEELMSNDVDMVKAKRVGVVGVIGYGLSNPLVLSRVIEGMNGDFPELKGPDAYKLTTGAFEASILADLPENRLKDLAQSIHDAVFGNQSAMGI